MDIVTLVPTIVYGSVLLFILGAIATLWYRMGNILKDVGRLEANVVNTQTSLNEKTAALQTSLNEVKDTVAQMQLQMQRNHYQLMMAILSHSHGPDGRPRFDLPPDFESSPTDE